VSDPDDNYPSVVRRTLGIEAHEVADHNRFRNDQPEGVHSSGISKGVAEGVFYVVPTCRD
jgi:hypothetical protein